MPFGFFLSRKKEEVISVLDLSILVLCSEAYVDKFYNFKSVFFYLVWPCELLILNGFHILAPCYSIN